MKYAATFGYRVWLRPEESHLARGWIAHDGEIAMRLGLATIPAAAETIAIDTILTLARATGARIHLARLSTHEGVARVREAKRSDMEITCDVSINHLHLCDVDIGWFNPNCRLIPPLRGVRDRDALRAGLGDGTIDAICPDHTSVDADTETLTIP